MRPRPTRAWTDVEAIEAVRQWAIGHGGSPPQTADLPATRPCPVAPTSYGILVAWHPSESGQGWPPGPAGMEARDGLWARDSRVAKVGAVPRSQEKLFESDAERIA
jgi:hypothetical protein